MTRRPRAVALAVSLLALALVAVACTPPDGDGDGASADSGASGDAAAGGDGGSGDDATATGTPTADGPPPVIVGVVMADSGLARRVDRPALAALRVEVDRANAEGGVDGRPIELRIADSETKFNATYDAANRFAEAGAEALVITCDFDFAAPALEVAQAFDIPAISPCGSDPRFRTSSALSAGVGADAEGRLLADVVGARSPATVAVVVETVNPEMTAMCDAFTQRYTSSGGTVTTEFGFDPAVIGLFDPEVLEPDPDISGLVAADAVVFCGSLATTGPRMLSILRENDVTAPVFTGSAMDGTDWLDDAVGDVTFLSWGSTFRNDPDDAVNGVVEGVRNTIGGSAEGGRMVAGADAGVALVRALQRSLDDPEAELLAMGGEELAVAAASWGTFDRMLDERPIRIIRVVDGEGIVDEVRVAPA